MGEVEPGINLFAALDGHLVGVDPGHGKALWRAIDPCAAPQGQGIGKWGWPDIDVDAARERREGLGALIRPVAGAVREEFEHGTVRAFEPDRAQMLAVVELDPIEKAIERRNDRAANAGIARRGDDMAMLDGSGIEAAPADGSIKGHGAPETREPTMAGSSILARRRGAPLLERPCQTQRSAKIRASCPAQRPCRPCGWKSPIRCRTSP